MKRRKQSRTLGKDPEWYKEAVIYELHVRAFCDANGDGMGDFRGLKQKLDYLQELGITAIWLLPFCPSPWRDDGYDIASFTGVHLAYGTLRDFQEFLLAAHDRNIRVITELVLNHTSDQHEWFQKSRRAKADSRWRHHYVWSDSPQVYSDARIIFKDFESSNWSWDPVAKAYYWHRFYSHQPDLNYDNPTVRQKMLKVLDFWMDLGVDGLRLDAVPYLFEREGTDCENLPETHAYLKEVRRHIESRYEDRVLLAEANQWPEDAVAYFGEGDECHMAFHFPLMPRLFMAARMEDRFPVTDILDQTPAIPEQAQWAIFLRNHDELTLEMVTDEERDYMYRSYAHDPQMRINLGIRRRLSPLLGNRRRLIELMNGLLLSLPGTPVIYYGDEIGMGDNIYLGDRNSVRTPMQWSSDRNAGFSTGHTHRLFLPVNTDPEYHYESVNVEAQQQNANSLLWWMKRMIALRKQSAALSRGSMELLNPENKRVLAFLRRAGDETVFVIANLSHYPQPVEFDLSEFEGMVPVEMSGRVVFPRIGELPYFITLGPHDFYWFSLELAENEEARPVGLSREAAPVVRVAAWDAVFTGTAVNRLLRVLPSYMKKQRWFRGKARTIRTAEMADVIPMPNGRSQGTLIRLAYSEGENDTYFLPLSIATGEQVIEIWNHHSDSIIARLEGPDGDEGVLYQALHTDEFRQTLLDGISRRRLMKGREGILAASPSRAFRSMLRGAAERLGSRLLRAEQSNSSVVYGDQFILKLFRKLEEGTNPDLEIGRHLTERVRFENVPSVAGWLEYRQKNAEPVTVGILQEFVDSHGDAWQYTQDRLGEYFRRVLVERAEFDWPPESPQRHPLDSLEVELPPAAQSLIGGYLDDAQLLGRRTAEMHTALSTAKGASEFEPEPFTDFYRNGVYHGMISLEKRVIEVLYQRLPRIPASVRREARQVLQLDRRLVEFFRPIRDNRITGTRIRHHGDYHLGQVLWTGRDFVIIDFEGEPDRPLGERKLKRSALRDVAGMLRSLHYAPYAGLLQGAPDVIVMEDDLPRLVAWADFWYICTAASFLSGYLEVASGSTFLPTTGEQLRTLLDAFVLEKALYEIRYELNNRPDWVQVPIRGILSLAGEAVADK